MELKEYIVIELMRVEGNILRILESLTQEEIAWRPSCGCNSIGLILFHIAKVDDSFILPILTGNKEIWEIEKWFEKLGLPITESGGQYTVEQVNAFKPPLLKDITAYSQAVRSKILSYVQEMKPNQFDRKTTVPYFGEMTIAEVLALMISHSSQHIGEMSYLRGLQRGLDK